MNGVFECTMQRHLLLALLVRCSLDLPSPLMLAVTFWRLWVVTNVTTDKQAFLVLEVVWCVDKTPGCSVMPILRGVMILQVVVMVQMMMLWVVVMLQVMVMLQVIVILVSLMKAQGHGLTRVPSQGRPWEVVWCVDKTPDGALPESTRGFPHELHVLHDAVFAF